MSVSNAQILPPPSRSTPRSARMLFRLLEQHLQAGRLSVEGPDGSVQHFVGAESGPSARWQIHDWRCIHGVMRDGDVGMGRTYFEGMWDSPDVTALIALAVRNRGALEAWIQGTWWRRRLFWVMDRLFRGNTERGSQRNIADHYDLGNDFYALWLDSGMSYSSAYYGDASALPLEAAQERKYALALEQLNLAPGARILEIGCGWGAFAEYAARQGYEVHGITLSQEQLRYAQARIQQAGLGHLVSLEYRDYRHVKGQYDGIVSIEMFEAVGQEWWSTYFRRINSLLRHGGRAVIQTILIANEQFTAYANGSDYIRRYVFPGGFLPSPAALSAELRRARLQTVQHQDFGRDYAQTLKLWRERFDAQESRLQSMGYDLTFRRLWRFYLAYCEAGFQEGSIDVSQWTISHG